MDRRSPQLRLELQSDNGDAQIVVNGNTFWISDPAAEHGLRGHASVERVEDRRARRQAPTMACRRSPSIQSEINKLVKHVEPVGRDRRATSPASRPTRSGSRPSTTAACSASVQLAWDAVKGVPLRIAIYARGNSTPVLELKATDISYGRSRPRTSRSTPPAGSQGREDRDAESFERRRTRRERRRASCAASARRARSSGVAAVADAGAVHARRARKLVGLPRQSVSLLDMGGKPAALVTYGQNLGGIVVIEQAQSADSAGQPQSQGSQDNGQPPVSLPTVSINGATGQELDTALGTVAHVHPRRGRLHGDRLGARRRRLRRPRGRCEPGRCLAGEPAARRGPRARQALRRADRRRAAST